MHERIARLGDLLALLLALPLALPLMLVIAVLVRLKLGSPIIFRQPRTGFGGREFDLFKFRSMTDERDASGALLPDEQRLTSFGRLLRSLSLDELPSLWNVARGDMGVVGPRPFLHDYYPLYSPVQKRRFEVRPGITGWAQVNGRNAITWPQKFALDVWYVDHRSFWLDVKILALTVRKVFARSGIDAEGGRIMPRFTGNEDG
ncbi:sugar transferase [Sphingomicrobium sp. XHP0239]|uniref:sugar transferase n=1 Tax=Sphingomicrobium maritimum TaxID=3133972 RepID=UPI0031CCB481